MKLSKKSVKDIEVKGKRILIRVDFDVPIDENGEVIDKQRIIESLPTIKHVLHRGAKSVVLISHLACQDGNSNQRYSLARVAKCLEELLGKPVTFLGERVGDAVEATCANPAPGSIFLLENLRFHAEEEGESSGVHSKIEDVELFRGRLDSLGDVYINDAFRFLHCEHSSIIGVDLPDMVAGLLVKSELDALHRILSEPLRPSVVIVGGFLSLRKVHIIENLVKHVDSVIICGQIAFTFLKVFRGMQIGDGEVDTAVAEVVHAISRKAKEFGCDIVLPVDWVCGKVDNMWAIKDDLVTSIFTVDVLEQGIAEGWAAMDCGPSSMEEFVSKIFAAKTILWIGPAGNLNIEYFSRGTRALFEAVVSVNASGGFTMIGDDELSGVAARWDMQDMLSFSSKGGDAFLHILEGKSLLGITMLADDMCPSTRKGIAEAGYAWSGAEMDRNADDDPIASNRITKYSWADGRKRVSIYVEVDGADRLAEEAFKVSSGRRSVSLVIELTGQKKCTFSIAGLWGEITDAKAVQKKGKGTVALHLQKLSEESWPTLIAESKASEIDDEDD